MSMERSQEMIDYVETNRFVDPETGEELEFKPGMAEPDDEEDDE